jgi:hypothetical protein
MKLLSRDIDEDIGNENIFNTTIGNDILHLDSNDNVGRSVKFTI